MAKFQAELGAGYADCMTWSVSNANQTRPMSTWQLCCVTWNTWAASASLRCYPDKTLWLFRIYVNREMVAVFEITVPILSSSLLNCVLHQLYDTIIRSQSLAGTAISQPVASKVAALLMQVGGFFQPSVSRLPNTDHPLCMYVL